MSDTSRSSTELPADPASITDRRTTPPGVVPRHLQQWVLMGIAVVMVGVLSLSGSPSKPRPPSSVSPATTAVDPNQQRIEEYQRRIQDQAQRLAAEQAQLQLTRQAVALDPNDSQPTTPRPGASARQPGPASPPLERAQREERALFADNVAFTSGPAARAGALPTPSVDDASSDARVPTTPVVPLASTPSLVPPVSATNTEPPPATSGRASTPAVSSPAAHVSRDERQDRVPEGTLIETVLTNRLDGTFNGPVNCLISVPVYGSDHQHLVIPAGSRALGDARAVNTFGQSRLAVVFHRIVLPNGTHVDLDGFHGLNQVGDLGLRDHVDRHYAQIFGVSLAIGAIGGLAQARSSVGIDASGVDTYRDGVAVSVAQSSARVLDRFLNLLPTVTIREGHRIKIYLSNDLELPAYRDALPVTGGQP